MRYQGERYPVLENALRLAIVRRPRCNVR